MGLFRRTKSQVQTGDHVTAAEPEASGDIQGEPKKEESDLIDISPTGSTGDGIDGGSDIHVRDTPSQAVKDEQQSDAVADSSAATPPSSVPQTDGAGSGGTGEGDPELGRHESSSSKTAATPELNSETPSKAPPAPSKGHIKGGSSAAPVRKSRSSRGTRERGKALNTELVNMDTPPKPRDRLPPLHTHRPRETHHAATSARNGSNTTRSEGRGSMGTAGGNNNNNANHNYLPSIQPYNINPYNNLMGSPGGKPNFIDDFPFKKEVNSSPYRSPPAAFPPPKKKRDGGRPFTSRKGQRMKSHQQQHQQQHQTDLPSSESHISPKKKRAHRRHVPPLVPPSGIPGGVVGALNTSPYHSSPRPPPTASGTQHHPDKVHRKPSWDDRFGTLESLPVELSIPQDPLVDNKKRRKKKKKKPSDIAVAHCALPPLNLPAHMGHEKRGGGVAGSPPPANILEDLQRAASNSGPQTKEVEDSSATADGGPTPVQTNASATEQGPEAAGGKDTNSKINANNAIGTSTTPPANTNKTGDIPTRGLVNSTAT